MSGGIAHLGAFIAAALLVIVVPGPATLFVLGRARGSRRRALLAVAGLVAGDVALITAAGLGLGALLLQWPAALATLRAIGAAYVAWLGIAMLRSASADAAAGAAVDDAGSGRACARSFVPALLLTLGNPKPILFFGAFFPLFIEAGSDAWLPAFWTLGALFELLNIAWFATLLAAVALLRRHAALPSGPWLNRIGGAGLVGCAALVLFA